MNVVDSHLHVWDLEVSEYNWLGPQQGPLYRSFRPDEAAKVLASAGIASAVLVQAEDSLADSEWLLEVADQHDWVHAVVGWIRLENSDDAARQLDQLSGPALRGIRHLVHDDPRPYFLDLPSVRNSLALVAERGLVFDVPDAWPRHLDTVVELAKHLPALTVVVDHLGKPPVKRGDFAAWEASLRRTAAQPNVVAKLSGLQSPGRPLTTDALRPVLEVALDAFGPERLMYGGDWPMTVPFGGYEAARRATAALISELSVDEQHAIWSGTATKTYGGNFHG